MLEVARSRAGPKVPCRSRRVGHVWSFGVHDGQWGQCCPFPLARDQHEAVSRRESAGAPTTRPSVWGTRHRGAAFVMEEPELKATPGECPAGGPQPGLLAPALLQITFFPSSAVPSRALGSGTRWLHPSTDPSQLYPAAHCSREGVGVHRTPRAAQPPPCSSDIET